MLMLTKRALQELERHTFLGGVAPKDKEAAEECRRNGLLYQTGYGQYQLSVRGLYVRNGSHPAVLVVHDGLPASQAHAA